MTEGRATVGEASGRPFWTLFAVLAAVIVVADQVTKALVLPAIEDGTRIEVVGDWLRFSLVHNTGALFGLFADAAPVFAVFSLVVMGVIVWFHAQSGRNLPVSVALGLLLGGAVGNLIDRVRLGYVVDFVDMGVGSWRFYTYNIADAAITTALVILIVATLLPDLARRLTPDA